MSILGLLGKLDIKTLLAMLCVGLSCTLCFFIWRNSGLKQNLMRTDLELQQANLNLDTLKSVLQKQNQAFKDLEVVATKKDTSGIDKIILKDSTCQAELKGYKELFKELGK